MTMSWSTQSKAALGSSIYRADWIQPDQLQSRHLRSPYEREQSSLNGYADTRIAIDVASSHWQPVRVPSTWTADSRWASLLSTDGSRVDGIGFTSAVRKLSGKWPCNGVEEASGRMESDAEQTSSRLGWHTCSRPAFSGESLLGVSLKDWKLDELAHCMTSKVA